MDLQIDLVPGAPLRRQLEHALRTAIRSCRLPPGSASSRHQRGKRLELVDSTGLEDGVFILTYRPSGNGSAKAA